MTVPAGTGLPCWGDSKALMLLAIRVPPKRSATLSVAWAIAAVVDLLRSTQVSRVNVVAKANASPPTTTVSALIR